MILKNQQVQHCMMRCHWAYAPLDFRALSSFGLDFLDLDGRGLRGVLAGLFSVMKPVWSLAAVTEKLGGMSTFPVRLERGESRGGCDSIGAFAH